MQLFEGRAFVVEDFEIRKPLILPDPASGVHLELSYDPNERTFAIQSRFDQGAAWSLHVVGSMRGERTESAFASTTWESAATPGTEPVEVEGFYRYMSDLGLRYGEEFRPIRELSAGAGHSAGRVALSEAIAARAGEYPLHPVLFDGALQTFSAGAATIEDRRSRMKLPVRFARILFLRSPGASARVRAGVLAVQRRIRRRPDRPLRRSRPAVRARRWLPRDQRLGRPPFRCAGWHARRGLPRGLGAHAVGIPSSATPAAAA